MSQQVLSPSLSRVQIERLDRDGLGIGTNLDTGKTINKIPKVLPGESICGYEKKNGFQVTSIETASSERVAAICPVYDRCGGCSFQHFGAQRTLNFKRDLACDLLSSVLDRDQIQWAFEGGVNQRRRVSLSYRKEKEQMKIGFFVQQTHFLVAVDHCPLLTSQLNDSIIPLRNFLDSFLQVRDEGFLHLTETLTGIDCSWSPNKKDPRFFDPILWSKWADFGQQHGFARITRAGKELIAEFRKPVIDLGGVLVEFPSAGFLQPSVQSQQAMQQFVVDTLLKKGYTKNGQHKICDLFCGLGTFSVPMLPFGQVHSIDCVGPWIEGLKKHNISNWTQTARDLMRNPLSLVELYPYDIIILDPPRAGAHAQTQILSQNISAKIVIMTSCDLTTAARDAAILVEKNYTCVECALFDQFPWTAHCEAILVFERNH